MLDVSGFSSDLPRYDVKLVYKRFEGSSSVQSIQFVPGKNVQITFKDSKTKESIEKHEYITINDVRCAVVGGGPKVLNVLIHHYPFEEDNHRLWLALSSFGEVRDIRYEHYPDLCSISTGTRVVKMVRNSPIPRSLDVGGYMCKTWYVGQPVECDICQGGHVSKNCPFKGKCRRCLESGHMARDCKNPPKSWSAGVSSGVLPSRPLTRLGALLLVFLILPLLRLRVEVLLLSYSLRVPMPLVLGVLLWI